MKRYVYNNSIGSTYSFNYPKLTKEQERDIIASLFEQLLIFDKVIITTNRLNFALYFLISKLGLKTVERLFEHDYIKLMLWTPILVSGSGRRLDDGTVDTNSIYGQTPIAAGTLHNDDIDPEKNINSAIQYFGLHRDKRKIFTKLASKQYIIPNGMEYSTDSAKLVIDSYKNNNLSELGLPYEKEPDQLDLNERQRLLGLGHKIIETAMLSKYELKSYENFEHYSICKQNLKNIGKAYKIAENTNVIFNLEGLPNLKSLYLNDRLEFEQVFQIRHLSNAKYYRKWINEVGEHMNAQEITKEYLNQIKGNGKFFETTNGKFLRNLALFGVNSAVGAALAGPIGLAAGYGIGLLETFWIDSILKGKNPSMFIENIENTLAE